MLSYKQYKFFKTLRNVTISIYNKRFVLSIFNYRFTTMTIKIHLYMAFNYYNIS